MSAANSPGFAAPGPGETWCTTHGVRMLMPKLGASKPYIRLDYTLGGARSQRTAGRSSNWESAWAQACEVDALIGAELGDPESLTVAQLADKWTKTKWDRWALRYRGDIAKGLADHVLPQIGRIRVSDLTREETRSVVLGQAAPSSRRHIANLLSSMLGWGVSDRLVQRSVRDMLPDLEEFLEQRVTIDADPSDPDAASTISQLENFDDDHDERKLKPIKQGTAPGTEDALRIIRYLQQPRSYESKHARRAYTPPEHYVLMFLVAAFCGLRQGEIWAMRGRDVKGSMLSVNMQLQWVDGKPVITPPKCGRTREVYIAEQVFEFPLRAMLAEHAAKIGPNGLMFPTSRGSYFRRSNFARDVMKPARAAAWPGKRWTFHGLRHHYCRWLLDGGYDIQDVAQLAGHSNAQITWTMYISPNEGLMERAARIEAQQRVREVGRDPHET